MFTLLPAFRSPVASRFGELIDEFDRITGASLPPRTPLTLWTKEDAVVVTLDLPGVRKEDIAIEASADTLTISGQRAAESAPAQATWLVRERASGRFSRAVQLPWRVDPDRVEARLAEGVLTIALVRAEADKPRKISVAA